MNGRRRGRHTLQLALVAVAWVAFVASWGIVARRTPVETMVRSGAIVALAAVATGLVTTAWIAHNLRVHRRKGPRRQSPPAGRLPTRDFRGRLLVADWDELRLSSVVQVLAGTERKVFAARPTSGPVP